MPRYSNTAVNRNRESQHIRNKKNNPNRGSRRKDSNPAYRKTLENRQFIGWDGEGYDAYVVDSTGECSIQHRYMLFGSSTGHYTKGLSLSTVECFELLLYVRRTFPDTFNVGFSFEYDVNMILKDLEWRYLAILTDTGKVKWRGYTIKHIPHKQFSVSKSGITTTIHDVFGFFHTSYLRALAKFGIGSKREIDRIAKGKAGRGTFTWAEIDTVLDYWRYEISLLPPLMDRLREACYTAGFYITQWHGPGALASYVLKKYGANTWHPKPKTVPTQIQVARRLAYAGGRFQAWKCGHFIGSIYTYDINSAYTAAIARLPRLDSGYWRPIPIGRLRSIQSGKEISRFALYRIHYDARDVADKYRAAHVPHPLFHRDKAGNLTWPPYVENWYWSPEAVSVAGDKYATFLEGWEFVSDDTDPFGFVHGAYERRLELQRNGDYTEKAYKWFLASIYGQFAQRVGWNIYSRLPPRSHCLEWAGYITSFTRAMVYMAARLASKKRGLISIDTDGITSLVPIDHEKLLYGVGEGLGQWKVDNYSEILYWQNGIYWLRRPDGEWEDPKTRGIPRGTIGRSQAFDSLKSHMVGRMVDPQCSINISRTRFIGYRQGLQHQWDNWRQWKTESVDVTFGGSGKGRHVPALCVLCSGGEAQMHTVTHLWSNELLSEPHKLPWLAPKPEPEQNIFLEGGIWQDETI
jgi:hypothetical protein